MSFEGQKVIVHNSRSRTFFYGPEFPSYQHHTVNYHGNINIKGVPLESYCTDLLYQPWMTLNGSDIIVGVGPYWKRVHLGINISKPIYLDDKGNLWAFHTYKDESGKKHYCIIRIRPEDWKECENSNYEIFLDKTWWTSPPWTAGGPTSLYVVSGDELLWFKVQYDYAFDIYERGFDVYDISSKDVLWGLHPTSGMVPSNHFYFLWNVKGDYVVLGGTSWIFHIWWWYQVWEEIVVNGPHIYHDKSEATGGMWNLPPPHWRNGVTIDGQGRLWFYWNGYQYAEIRDTSLNLLETRTVNWNRKPIIAPNYDYVIGNRIYKSPNYTQSEVLNIPKEVWWSGNVRPLGNSTTIWLVPYQDAEVYRGGLCDTNEGKHIEPRGCNITFGDQMSSDEGLSWYAVFGGPPPKVDAIFDYVIHPDEIRDALGC